MSSKVKLDYRVAKGSLRDRGYTLASWARENGFQPTTVYDAARGARNGIISRQIRRELAKAIA